MKKHWMLYALAPCVVVVAVMGAWAQVLPSMPKPLTPLEQNITTRAALAFGDAPHLLMVYANRAPSLRWFYSPEGWDRIRKGGFGDLVVTWKDSLTTGQQPEGGAPLEDDGHLHFVSDAETRKFVNYVHNAGGRALFYVSPGNWSKRGLLATDEVLRVVDEYGFDGIYTDGVRFGDSPLESARSYQRLKARGLYIVAHCSRQHAGQVEYLEPFADHVDMILWGESNKANLGTVEEAEATLKRVLPVEMYPGKLFIYKAARDTVWDADPARRLLAVVKHLCAVHFGTNNFWIWERYGKEAWLEAQAKWRANPEEYARALAKEW